MYELIFLGLALMVAPVFAKYAGYEKGGHFDLIGVGGLFFLVAAATHVPIFTVHDLLGTVGLYLSILTQGLGILLLGIGTLWGLLDIVVKTPVHVR